MTDYKKYIYALRKCAKEHENDRTFTGHIIVSDLCRDTANLLEELEQEPKTGHWIPIYGNVKCSVCGSVKDSREVGKATHYCDFCGAKMESEVEDGECK